MGENKKTLGWADLTIPNAVEVKNFYENVMQWQSQGFDMGGYEDYCMIPAEGDDPLCGICHAKGPNAELPAQWILYFTVDDIKTSLAACESHGGKQLTEIQNAGTGIYAVIQDPAGAVCALYQKIEKS